MATPEREIINFSLDIETLGLQPGSIVTEIGICNNYSADELHIYLSIEMQKALGLAIDNETLAWHKESNPNFETMFANCAEEDAGMAHFVDQLRQVTAYFAQFENHQHAIWMNSPSFDAVLLSVLYGGAGLPMPWNHRAPRDLRTLRDLAERRNMTHANYVGTMPVKPDNAHDALVDAKYQLEIVTICLADLA